MVNTEDFIKRLEMILDYYSLSASLFADKLGVQRSGLSHLMSGRNKPSLDFVMKIVEAFPDVDLYWLLNGEGTFPKKTGSEIAMPEVPPPATSTSFPAPPVAAEKKETEIGDLFSQPEEIPLETAAPLQSEIEARPSGKKTERIVVFYSDGTFKEYFPEG